MKKKILRISILAVVLMDVGVSIHPVNATSPIRTMMKTKDVLINLDLLEGDRWDGSVHYGKWGRHGNRFILPGGWKARFFHNRLEDESAERSRFRYRGRGGMGGLGYRGYASLLAVSGAFSHYLHSIRSSDLPLR